VLTNITFAPGSGFPETSDIVPDIVTASNPNSRGNVKKKQRLASVVLKINFALILFFGLFDQ
tara:strand:+ start:3106 stop:3291 length:186 start_codon:yes stop_codon:yes gene_type:complete